MRRLCVFGAGAVGGHLAARLAGAGYEVSVVARGENLAGLKSRGVILKSEGTPDIGGRVKASDRASDLGPQDAVLVTLKATGLPSFAEQAAALTGPDTVFAFVQNGVPWWYAQGLSPDRPKPPDLSRLDPGGALARAIAPERVLGGVVYSSNILVEPGVVESYTNGADHLVLGEPGGGESPRTLALRACLEASGMPSPATRDIREALWAKLLNNLAAALCVLVREPLRVLSEDESLRSLRDAIRAEARAIATAHGVSVDGAPRRPGGSPSPKANEHKPSMLQDLELNRPMEVEAILRTPLAFARAAGVPAPRLEMLTALVSRLAAAQGLYTP